MQTGFPKSISLYQQSNRGQSLDGHPKRSINAIIRLAYVLLGGVQNTSNKCQYFLQYVRNIPPQSDSGHPSTARVCRESGCDVTASAAPTQAHTNTHTQTSRTCRQLAIDTLSVWLDGHTTQTLLLHLLPVIHGHIELISETQNASITNEKNVIYKLAVSYYSLPS